MRPDEISHAFKFGNTGSGPDVLEPNWWETKEAGEEDDVVEMEESKPTNADTAPRIIARTRLHFSPEQVQQFRTMGLAPQIKILGFQSPDNLSLEDNVKHSYFIYPDEETYTGSTRTFAALLKSCLKKDKHALALCRFRANNPPEFAVLIPQEEVLTEGGGQEMPPGFHVIILPFRDDIREKPRNITDNLIGMFSVLSRS